MKKISMMLDAQSVSNAIKELDAYAKIFAQKKSEFLTALINRGVEIAVEQVMSIGLSSRATAELAGSIKPIMYVEEGRGVIFVGCPWAIYVEFGTGVVGSQSPHPAFPWSYDVNEHGESGWVYFDKNQNKFRWTKGMPSRPFLYRTLQELQAEANTIAGGIFT